MTVLGVSYVSVVCRVRPCVTVAHADRRGRDMARAVIHSRVRWSARPDVCVCARPARSRVPSADGTAYESARISFPIPYPSRPLVPSTHRRTSYHEPLVYTNSLNRALCGLSGNADDDPAPRDEEGHFQMIVR